MLSHGSDLDAGVIAAVHGRIETAAAQHFILDASAEAKRLVKEHPEIRSDALTREIIRLAADAGVPVFAS